MEAPDPHCRAVTLAQVLAPADELELALPDGRFSRARVKLLAADHVVATAQAERIAGATRVSTRSWRAGRIHVLELAVEEIEPTVGDRADALLRLDGATLLAERPAAPALLDQPGSALASVDVDRGQHLRPARVLVVEATDRHVAYIADRRRTAGERIDLRFADGVGGEIRCRLGVVRVETLMRRRTRHVCELVAISDVDARRLGALVRRADLTGGTLRPAS